MRTLATLSALLAGCTCGQQAGSDAGFEDAAPSVDTAESPDAARFDAQVVPRPPPPWDPPIPVEDGVGWRESTEAPCSPFAGRSHAGMLWADERGVFGLLGTLNNMLARDPPFPDGVSLHFNDGSGWVEWHRVPFEPGSGGARAMTGAPSGPIYLWNGGCPLQRVGGAGDVSCVHDASQVTGAYFYADDEGVVAIGDPVAVSAYDHGSVTSLVTLDDIELPLGLWADRSGVVVGTPTRVLAGPARGPLVAITETAPPGPYSAFFARAIDDVWLASQDPPSRLFHYNGTSWVTFDSGLGEQVVAGIWADASTAYYFSARTFARRAAAPEIVFEIPIEYPAIVTGVAGNATRGEVYLSIMDDTFIPYACGPTVFVVYDGTSLRRF